MTPLIILLQPDTYIILIGLLLVFLSAAACWWCFHLRKKWKRAAVTLFILGCWHVYLWGSFVGPQLLEVKQVEFCSAELPPAFDGYRIVLFSDAHVGSFIGWRKPLLKEFVDSINAQHADMIIFAGDLQNIRPQEIQQHQDVLSTLEAPDGVYTVLGNHDYTDYLRTNDYYEQYLNTGLAQNIPADMGWTLLLNDRVAIKRDSARIIVAGMENDGEGRFPERGDLNSALFGVNRNDFIIMIEHDPTSWKRKILPHSHCQLTLSGHTHGGQLAFMGWSPAQLTYKEIGGMYTAGDRALYVSTGIGGVIPFRFGVPPEIVVITLRHKN